jgi:hypothetical protein
MTDWPHTLLDCEHALLGAVLDGWMRHDQLQLEDHHLTLGISRAIWRHSRSVPAAELGEYLQHLSKTNPDRHSPAAELVVAELQLLPCLPPSQLHAAAQRLRDAYDARQLLGTVEAVAGGLRRGELGLSAARAALAEVCT